MDIRIEKTEKAIKNAFTELRAKKPLEKITIKELCQLACINKSTFYSHYCDIYALSEALEIETVNSILKSIPHDREYTAENPVEFTKELCLAFLSHTHMINILFSGAQQSNLANRLEISIKEIIYKKYPEYRDDVEKRLLLSYCILGGYHTYINNQSEDRDTLFRVIVETAGKLKPLY